MIDGSLFNTLNHVAKRMRNRKHPFGGLQLVICGDFLQLPPVGNKVTGEPPTFAFESTTWKALKLMTIQLKHVFRQQDEAFVAILAEMRGGTVSSASEAVLNSLNRPIQGLLDATYLYPLRNQVDQHNCIKLDALPGAETTYKALDYAPFDEDLRKLDEWTLAPKLLKLKVGCQVILVRNSQNSDEVNGQIGIVTSLSDMDINVRFYEAGTKRMRERDSIISRIKFEIENAERKVIASRSQFPLMLAYSLTIHKAQGQTLPLVRVCDINKGGYEKNI